MDGFAWSLIYGLQCMAPFPVADLPITESVMTTSDKGPYLLYQTDWYGIGNGQIAERIRSFDSAHATTHDHINRYTLGADGYPVKRVSYSNPAAPFETAEYRYAGGHLDKISIHSIASGDRAETYLWSGAELNRVIQDRKSADTLIRIFTWENGRIHDYADSGWLDGGYARYAYPSADSIIAQNLSLIDTRDAFGFADGKLLGYVKGPLTGTISYGTSNAIRRRTSARPRGFSASLRDALGRAAPFRADLPSGAWRDSRRQR
jgi:hypothetical protein